MLTAMDEAIQWWKPYRDVHTIHLGIYSHEWLTLQGKGEFLEYNKVELYFGTWMGQKLHSIGVGLEQIWQEFSWIGETF